MITDHSILILVVDIYNKQNNGISCLYISGTWCNTIYRFFVYVQGKYLHFCRRVCTNSLAARTLSRQSAQGFMPEEHHLSLTLNWPEPRSHSRTIGQFKGKGEELTFSVSKWQPPRGSTKLLSLTKKIYLFIFTIPPFLI